MLGKDCNAYERLRRLSGITGRVLEGLVAACARPGIGPGRPCEYPLQMQVLLVKLRLDRKRPAASPGQTLLKGAGYAF